MWEEHHRRLLANESTRYARPSVVPVKPDPVITAINRYRTVMAELDKIALPNGHPADETEEYAVWETASHKAQDVAATGAKDLEMFKDALPQASRIGILWNPTTPSHPPALKAVEAAGAMLEVSLHMVPMSTVEDLDGAFATMTRERLDGFLVVASPVALSQRARLAELALAHRLPGVFASKENVEAGGFMSYGPDNDDLTRRAALYIVKILNGTKPADLPVEQATKFELVVNLKTVKVLGLKISESFLLRANEIIE